MVTTDAAIDALEQRLAGLRHQHAATEAAIAEAEEALRPLEVAREAAHAIYDEAGRAMAQALQGQAHEPYGTWTPQSGEEEERLRAAQRLVEGAFGQAREELERALIAYTEGGKRRGHHLMMRHRIEAAIAQAEHELEQARQAPARERDLLQSIRDRLGLGRPQPAA